MRLIFAALVFFTSLCFAESKSQNKKIFDPTDPKSFGTFYDRGTDRRQRSNLPLNNPALVKASQADFMKNEDVVAGVDINGHRRAYPWWVLRAYHVANDSMVFEKKSTYWMVTLCEVCSGASAFYTEHKNNPFVHSTFYLCEMRLDWGTFQICDVETKSAWHPFIGKATKGPMTGSKLKRIPVMLKKWKDWKRIFPNSDVVVGSDELRNRGHSNDVDAPGHINTFGNAQDKRLKKNELVFGLGNKPVVYALDRISSPIFVDKKENIILVKLNNFSALAYRTKFPDQKLKGLKVVSKKPLKFKDSTGTVWNYQGHAISGKLRDRKLKPADGYVTEWYEYQRFFKKIKILPKK